MTVLSGILEWFADPANWQGPDGVPARTLQHLWYSLSATVVALLIALPIGLGLGHTGRGGQVAINLTNLGRAIPSFGIIILAFFVAGFGFTPVLVTLVALALPPIVTNSFVGVQAVDPEIRDAAEGMGMTGWQVLTRVEVPVAVPLIMAGVRTSAVQVVATAALAAFIGLGGLGRYIFDGLSQRNTPEVVAGALLVAVLSLLVEVLLGAAQRALTPSGVKAPTTQRAGEAVAQLEPAQKFG